MKYEAVVGLEVHVQLATHSKMFCGCGVDVFGSPPNTHTCPVCSGMPGVLPVINQQAVEFAIMAGLALNCQIAEFTKWDRKNYHYPDLPKGYQISQYDLPLCRDGWLMVQVDDRRQKIRIRRAHLEEDAGKLLHQQEHSLVDLNRAGIPLLEIVTEPDMRSGDEAYALLTSLRTILRYLGVSSGDMEKGAMRCEPNVSVRAAGSQKLGIRTEIKNLNSFRSVRAGIAYEIERQRQLLEAGEPVEQVTMGWIEEQGVTIPQRSKEGAADYRYFPDPDLPPLLVSRQWVERLRAQLPELPAAKKRRFVQDYQLSSYDADVLVADRGVADFFESAAGAYPGEAKMISNWVSGELFRMMKDENVDIQEIKIRPESLTELVLLVDQDAINQTTAREVFREMIQSGRGASEIVQSQGLAQILDRSVLEAAVAQVLAENPHQVQQYQAGKETIIQWLMGRVMRSTGGKANPQIILALLQEQLNR